MVEAWEWIRRLLGRSVDGRTAGLVLAVFVAGLFAWGVLMPRLSVGEPLPVHSGAPAAGPLPSAASDTGPRLVRGAKYAGRQQTLSPFSGYHASRSAAPSAMPASSLTSRQGAGREARGAPAAEKPLCFTGVVRGAAGAVAIFSRGGQQLMLSPGETSGGVTLVSLTDVSAVVRDAAGERELFLGKR